MKKKAAIKSDALSKQQKSLVRRVLKDPVMFAAYILGVNLWERQVEILRSMKDRRRTAVKACHSSGKTFILAVATLWWLARYRQGIVLTTSPTQRQVRTQLWAEIHRLVERARVPYPQLKTTELKFRDHDNFAIGFSTNQTENFQGYHGKDVLIVADEAPGIESGLWDAIAGTMAGGRVHLAMAGNPTSPMGAFFDAFTSELELWNCTTIDAFDSPNLAGIGLDDLLRMDSAEGGPLDQNPVPYLVTKRWVADQYKSWWHGDEQNSPNWLSRVRGQFPGQAHNALFKLRWLELAKGPAQDASANDQEQSLVAGIDVGGGTAETVAYVCSSKAHEFKIIAMRAWRGEDKRGAAVQFLADYRKSLRSVRVDGIGIGHNFGLHLRDQRFPMELINVSRACDSRPELRENDPAKRFLNLKVQYYQEWPMPSNAARCRV